MRVSQLPDHHTAQCLDADFGLGLHTSQDEQRVFRLREILFQDDPGANSGSFVQKNFDDYREFLNLVQKGKIDDTWMTLNDLQRAEEFHMWDTEHSSLLILHGYNHAEIRLMSQSWLSLAVLEFIHQIKSTSRSVVAHCSVDRDTHPETILRDIIAQLLDQRPQVLRQADDKNEIESCLRQTASPNRQGAALQVSTSALQGCMRATRRIAEIYNGQIDSAPYIVIDRPELAIGENPWEILRGLTDIVMAVRVKVLVVIRTELWDIEERIRDLEKGAITSNKLITMRRDQEIL